MRNNQNAIARRINNLNLAGVQAAGDDGSVCVQVSGNEARVHEIANDILEHVGDVETSDGAQEGGIWINCDECNIHDDLSSVAQ